MGELVFVVVLLARLAVPLAIPRWPLPAIVAALVIDAADQTIFAAFDAEPANYQSYDKALDIYYLTVAYLSTLRNWTDGFAFATAQFLWYYRLVGVVAFELAEVRALLLVFPNTFEYFFIAYEGVRTMWDPRRLGRRRVLLLAAFIWVFIKLPQEWWIHVAQLDFTDFMADHPWMWGVLAAAAIGAIAALIASRDRIPATDWSLTFDVDRHPTTIASIPADPPTHRWAPIRHPLIEKAALVGLVSVIFVQILPDVDASPLETVLVAAVAVVANAFAGYWLASRGRRWASAATEFVGMGAFNTAVVGVLWWWRSDSPEGIPVGQALFMVALLTLIVTLYSRYRLERLPGASRVPWLPRVTPTTPPATP